MPTSDKRGPGRPTLDANLKRAPINIRLPPWLLERMREEPESQSRLIERAVCRLKRWKAPKIPKQRKRRT